MERASDTPGSATGIERPPLRARLLRRLRDRGPDAVAKRFAGLAYLMRIANAGVAFLTQILLARWMGAHEFGVYVYVWTWVVLLGTVTTFGLSSSPQRFIPTFVEQGRLDELRGFIIGSRVLAFLIASAFAAVAALGLLLASDVVTSWPLIPLYLGLACLPLFVVTEVQDGIARAYDWPGVAMAPTYLLRPFLLVAGLAALHFAGIEPGAVSAMAAAIAATWIAGLWQLLSLRRRLKERVEPGPRLYRPRIWLRVAFPQLLMDSFYLLLTYCDVIILERFVEPDAVAIYYAATKLVSIVAFVYFSVAAAATHKFTQFHVTGRPDELKAFMRAAIGWTFLPSLGMAIVILVLGEPLLAMFGPSFPGAYPLLPALLVGLLARASIGPVEKLLSMLGHQGACAYVYAFAFAANIALSIALVPHLGLMGAAIATSSALILESILLFILAKQLLSIHVFYWGAAKKRPS